MFLGPDQEPWPRGWTPATIIKTLEPLLLPERRDRLAAVAAERLESVAVLLDRPYDPHNVAAVMRSCDAFGLHTLHVVPGAETPQPSPKVSQGTERWVHGVRHHSAEAAVLWLKRRGYALVATHPEGELVPEQLEALPRPALLMGNEHEGLCPTLESAATHRVRIPMRGFVSSLNLSVASALLLRSATKGRPGDLSSEQRDRVYARGLYRSVSHAAEILAASEHHHSKHGAAIAEGHPGR